MPPHAAVRPPNNNPTLCTVSPKPCRQVLAPRVVLRILDAAIQVHGAAGVSSDTPLANLFAEVRRHPLMPLFRLPSAPKTAVAAFFCHPCPRIYRPLFLQGALWHGAELPAVICGRRLLLTCLLYPIGTHAAARGRP